MEAKSFALFAVCVGITFGIVRYMHSAIETSTLALAKLATLQ